MAVWLALGFGLSIGWSIGFVTIPAYDALCEWRDRKRRRNHPINVIDLTHVRAARRAGRNHHR